MIPDIETRDDYEQAMIYHDNLWNELNKPRCALCESNRKGKCVKFMQEIPPEFMYKKTTCQEFAHDIPF